MSIKSSTLFYVHSFQAWEDFEIQFTCDDFLKLIGTYLPGSSYFTCDEFLRYVATNNPSQAEVGYFGVLLLIQKNVAGFQISVDDP